MTRPCPRCGAPADLEHENPNRPFCSERCRLVDLGAWLDERYSVPGEPAPDDVVVPQDRGPDDD